MPTQLQGGAELRLALKKFAPDLAKGTQKEMATALKTITSKARGYLPADSQMLSGWTSALSSAETINYRAFPKYSQLEAKRGIRYSTTPSRPNRSGFVALARVMNTSAGGAIYETSGRKSPNGRAAGGMVRVVYPLHPNFGKMIPNSDKTKSASLNPNAGKQFITRANELGQLVNARPAGMVGRATRKMTGRVIFRAYAEDQGKATAAVIKAIEQAGINLNKRAKVNNNG
jgi:hypothetical protein